MESFILTRLTPSELYFLANLSTQILLVNLRIGHVRVRLVKYAVFKPNLLFG